MIPKEVADIMDILYNSTDLDDIAISNIAWDIYNSLCREGQDG